MTTLYVVTSGTYSDYHIEGVFSTRELAEKWIDEVRVKRGTSYWYNAHNDIEEYELDKFVEETSAYVYTICDHLGIDTPKNEESCQWIEDVSPYTPAHYIASAYRTEYKGYGKTIEHARRAASELQRAVRAGNIVEEEKEET
jgi:hypothetical protein